MLKVELHTHTADDPADRIPHTALELIDHAASLGYDALAITLHERQLNVDRITGYAADRGLVLIRGVERTVEGRHVLLLNFATGADEVRTFRDLARLKAQQSGLIIAPHPFFPGSMCLGRELERNAHLFDAVECNAMYARGVDFNRRAQRWARRHGKPLVGNCDVHRLWQLGPTYSLVDAPWDADSICAAIAAGRVTVESQPMSWVDVARVLGVMLRSEAEPRILQDRDDRKTSRLDVDDQGVLEMQ